MNDGSPVNTAILGITKMRYNRRMSKWDEIAINIELALISLIEGFALVNLAEQAVPLLNSDALQYLPYILSGLVIILVFWSQSILHAVSFIRWPMNMGHMFLYFVAAFVQVVAYSNLTNIRMWFFWWTVFTLIGFGMYVLDLKIIRSMHGVLEKTYIDAVERRHVYEMKVLVPFALAFNFLMLVLVSYHPNLFVSPFAYAIPALLQLAISSGALYDCVRNFRERSAMIAHRVIS